MLNILYNGAVILNIKVRVHSDNKSGRLLARGSLTKDWLCKYSQSYANKAFSVERFIEQYMIE